MVHRILVDLLRWVPGLAIISGCHLLVLLPFRQEMVTVLPVVSLATGDRNAPKLSVQHLKVICRVTVDRMMMEKVCLTILLILTSVISPKFVPKSLCESENFEFEDVVPFNVSADRPQVSVKGKLLKSIVHWQLLGAPDFIY